MNTTVGFVGLGTMGLPMVTNLAKAGMRLVVHDVNPAAVETASRLPGVERAPAPRVVAQRAEVMFTCLPDDPIVREVYLGPDGIVAGAAAGSVTCDCSTVSPELTLLLAGALAARGVTHLDTPMLGSQPQAVAGEIFFIVGGEAAALPRVAPCLAAMGRLHMHVGPSASGNRIKLIHNGLAAVVSVAVAEALATAVAAGVDTATLFQVVQKGGGMAHGTYWERRVKRILDGDFSPTFMLQHMRKDSTLALEHARALGVPVPLHEETQRTYDEALAAGWGAEDFSAVTRVIERRLGRPIAHP